jgi:uncharacterized protein (DUF2141 family)
MANVYKSGFRFLGIAAIMSLLMILSSGCSKSDSNPVATQNHPPTVNSVTCSPTSVGSNGGAITVTVSATDSDGDQLTYSYSVSLGTIAGNGATAIWTVPATEGAHTVSVTVSDGVASAVGQSGVSVAASATVITGTLTLQPGVQGDLGNTQVAIYVNLNDWNTYNPVMYVAAAGTGASVTYTISNVPPGTYYLDVWKDNDGNSVWSSGDFVGWYGSGALSAPLLSPLAITQGETKVISISGIVPVP